jgi:hypothetical protein
MKSISAVLGCIGLILSGCVMPAYNYIATPIAIDRPAAEAVITAAVGDKVVFQGMLTDHAGVRVDEIVKVGPLRLYTLTPGVYLKVGEKNGKEFYQPDPASGASIIRGLIADPPKMVQVVGDNRLCVVTVFNLAECKSGVKFVRRQFQIESADTLQQALIYNGRIGNRILLSYRESSGAPTRTEFKNNAEYDLNASRVIAYKEARIEVIEATNEYLKYRVLQNFKLSPKT